MNDDDKTPPPLKAPARAKKMSRESQWIGIVVLAFGLIAMITVGILAFSRFSGGDNNVEQALQRQQQEQAQQSARQATPQSSVPSSQAPAAKPASRSGDLLSSMNKMGDSDDKELAIDKETIAYGDIKGAWEIGLPEHVGVVDFKGDGTYRILLEDTKNTSKRLYSNGTYELQENGVLILTPNSSMRPPVDGYSYRAVYQGPYALQLSLQKGYMIWTAPPANLGFYQSSVHPFLRFAPENLAVWERL
jgi:hypothetical protein